jgi:hypothetical protein
MIRMVLDVFKAGTESLEGLDVARDLYRYDDTGFGKLANRVIPSRGLRDTPIGLAVIRKMAASVAGIAQFAAPSAELPYSE